MNRNTKEGVPMRAATVFNFLIESTLMGSIMILLMMAVRTDLSSFQSIKS